MKGSEKQIKWAQDIINDAMSAFDNMENDYQKLDNYGDPKLAYDTLKYHLGDIEAVKAELMAVLDTVDDAGKIIELRQHMTFEALEKRVKTHARA